jgi:hypothetical protein
MAVRRSGADELREEQEHEKPETRRESRLAPRQKLVRHHHHITPLVRSFIDKRTAENVKSLTRAAPLPERANAQPSMRDR